MKKKIALLLATAMILPLLFAGSCVFGEADNEGEILRLKKLFDIDDIYEHFDMDKQETEVGVMNGYHWNSEDSSVDVFTDGDGTVRMYQFYARDNQGQKMLDPKGLEQVADDWFKKIDPEGFKEFKRLDRFTNYDLRGEASFVYQRYVNGLPVLDDQAFITLNMADKSLVNYVRGTDIPRIGKDAFPTPKDGMAKKGKDLFEKELGYEKMLTLREIKRDEYKSTPYYGMLDEDKVIDVEKGEVIPRSRFSGFGAMAADEAAAKESGLTPEERKEVEKIESAVSKEEAMERAKEFYNLSGFELSGSNLSKYGERFRWYLAYKKGDEKFADFSIDAEDKALLSMSLPRKEHEGRQEELPKVDMTNKVLAFIDKAEPGLQSHLDPKKMTAEGSPMQYISVPRKEGDFYYDGEGVDVQISERTKEVYNYDKNFTPALGAEPKKDIGLAKAEDIGYSAGDLGLMYMYRDGKPMFVYGMVNPVKVNMETGETEGGPREVKVFTYSDLKESAYPEEAKLLGIYGIGFPEGTLSPRLAVTQGEFIEILNQSYYGGNREPADIIEEIRRLTGIQAEPEKPATTLFITEVSLKLQGFKGQERMKDLWNPELFKDFKKYNDKEKAYLFSAVAMDFLSREGELRGNEPATRDDVIHMTYQLLNYKEEQRV